MSSGIITGLAAVLSHHSSAGEIAYGIGMIFVGVLWCCYCLFCFYLMAKVKVVMKLGILTLGHEGFSVSSLYSYFIFIVV